MRFLKWLLSLCLVFCSLGLRVLVCPSWARAHSQKATIGITLWELGCMRWELCFLSAGFFLWVGKKGEKLWSFLSESKFIFSWKILELIALGKQVEIKISLLSAEKIALRRYFFIKENLDEHRLKNILLDFLVFICYNKTIKRKEVKLKWKLLLFSTLSESLPIGSAFSI